MSLAASAEVKAIGLSGQMHSSVFLDAEDEVIRPALLWSDGRTTSQCREITETLGLDGLRDTVGNLALEGFTAPKVLWLRDNEPEHYGRLRKLMLAKDYVRLKLTGETSTEPSDAAGTLLFDVRQRRWSGEVLSALDIDPAIMPLVVGSTEVSGRLLPDVAKALGLPSGVPVVGGGADNAAGATGSGVIGQGMVQASIGTSGTVLTPLNKPQVDESMSLHTFCHCAGDLWYLMGVILSAGSSLQWLRGITHPGATYDEMTAEAAQVRTGADGLFFLPYLTGERTPHNDSNARGVFFGLHLGHSSAHMVRARHGGGLLRHARLVGADAGSRRRGVGREGNRRRGPERPVATDAGGRLRSACRGTGVFRRTGLWRCRHGRGWGRHVRVDCRGVGELGERRTHHRARTEACRGLRRALRPVQGALSSDERALRHGRQAPGLRPYSRRRTAWPPNWFLIAARSLAPKGESWRDRNRACTDAVITGSGIARSMDSSTVHRPSPESST